MLVHKSINSLKKIALILFLTSSTAIIGSVLFHNYLINFKFDLQMNFSALSIDDEPGSIIKVKCESGNGYCASKEFLKEGNSIRAPKSTELSNCYLHLTKVNWVIDGKRYNDTYSGREELFIDFDYKDYLSGKLKVKEKYKNSDIYFELFVIDEKNPYCIRNSSSFYLYKFFPSYYEEIVKLRQGLVLGTNKAINPFLYGESSISNVTKRFPINIIFKGFLYISVILMLIYWNTFNNFFNKVLNQNKNYFFYFGMSSAIFLFFYVLFLGSEIDNEIFQKIRRLMPILYLLTKLIAIITLTRGLFLNSSKLSDYCNLNLIKAKILFVYIIITISVVMILILIFYDLSSQVAYILEWNYFLGLLIFYLISSLMLRKNKYDVNSSKN